MDFMDFWPMAKNGLRPFGLVGRLLGLFGGKNSDKTAPIHRAPEPALLGLVIKLVVLREGVFSAKNS